MSEKGVRLGAFTLIFDSEDISLDIAPVTERITYTDRQHGMADEAAVTIADGAGLWRDKIRPKGGELFTLSLGYAGEEMLPCGSFEIDAPEYTPGHIVLKGSSTSVIQTLHTKQVERYRDTTLEGIVRKIAARNRLQVQGSFASIPFTVKNQDDTDLEFLNTLANDYGYVCKVYPGTLVFIPYKEIEADEPVAELSWQSLINPRFTVNDRSRYRAVEIKYFRKGKLHTARAEDTTVRTENILREKERCENSAQAEAMAAALLNRSNRGYITGSFEVPGNILLASGNTFTLTHAGLLNGTYMIQESAHTQQDGSYSTACEVYHVKG